MKKQFISKFATFAALAGIATGIITMHSCKKDEDLMTEIKVEDTEDTESTKEAIGVAEIEKKYEYMTTVYEDSINSELEKLRAEYNLIVDTLGTILEAKAGIQMDRDELNQTLSQDQDWHEFDLTEEEQLMVLRLQTEAAQVMGDVMSAQVDSAANQVKIAKSGIEIAIAQAEQANDLALAAQKAMTAMAEEEENTYDAMKFAQAAMQELLADSVLNVYDLAVKMYNAESDVNSAKQDSIANAYSLLYKSIDEYNAFMEDTAANNASLTFELEKTRNDLAFDLLEEANNQAIELYEETERVKADLLEAQLNAEKDLDAAQKAYDDYVASKSILENEEKTELSIVLFSMDANDNSSLLTGDATVTLDGEEVALTNGMATLLGDLEGNHFVTVTAAGHLKTQFSFEIAENSDNDDADGFKLYKQRLEIKLLQSTNSFTVRGNVSANTIDHEFYQLGAGYDYLEETDVFEIISDADLAQSIQNEMDKRDNDEGTNEDVADLDVSVKVDGAVSYIDYVAGDVVNVSNFYMENTTAISATTDADGNYELTGVPVLNSDFDVYVVVENTRIDQSYIFYGQDVNVTKVTKVVKYNTQLVQNEEVQIANGERANGIVLFKDFVLF